MIEIIIFVLIAIAAIVAFILSRSNLLYVSHSIEINAPIELVFNNVNNLQNFAEWSPWTALDESMSTEFTGPTEGESACFSWDGDKKVGAGTMIIVTSKSNEHIRMQLNFLRPFKNQTAAEFYFAKLEDNLTRVNWVMSDKKDFLAKAFGLFFNIEKQISEQFETGLKRLQALCEVPRKVTT